MDEDVMKKEVKQHLMESIRHAVAALYILGEGNTQNIEEAVQWGLGDVALVAYCDIHA